MNLEQLLAAKIGGLVVENAKLVFMVEALKAEIAKRDDALAKLKAAEPEVPMGKADAKANGHAEAAH